MRKIVVFNLVSLDGYFAGTDGNIDWHQVDDDFNKFAAEQTSFFGTIIFGRTTYQLFESFWPTAVKNPKFSADDQKIAQLIEDAEKIVFSKTLGKVTWNNAKLFTDIATDEINKLKQKDGKDMIIFGSGTIVAQMANLGLIDEYRLLVNPVILGEGKSMFQGVNMQQLKLANTRKFDNGNVMLTYVS